MKKWLVILLVSTNLVGQKLEVRDSLIWKAGTFLGYDNLGATYGLNENVLVKNASNISWEFRLPQLGKISRVDLLNPLKIVVFFQDFNTVALLDNQLNLTEKIDFSQRTTDPMILQATGLASGNRLWVYDGLSQRIGLYDYTKKEFRRLGTPLREAPVNYDSDFNYFRWVNARGEAFSCDVYGKIQALGKVPEHQQLVWATNTILLYKNGSHLYRYDLVENKSVLVAIGEKTFENFSYKDQILSIFTNQGITNYKITIP
ncbi:hypothetical protein G4D82_12875 [Flavobacterium sp. CYK-4]|uniref:hypothetical protein n=1 Tax=Flavobacterium lotistagni TaxID=2709660 RepID=UPI00140D4BE3|nr:hypothetical protein [Flavobacterium lotistagni]NHM08119.1 hypothetical protein [Flavobacterium lotistagni]